jgi:hypothetical protein
MNLSLDFSWMAWTWPTATFFLVIAAMLVGMTLWEWAVPGGSPRYGVLGIETTRAIAPEQTVLRIFEQRVFVARGALLVGGAGEDHPVQRLQAPAFVHEGRGQVV